MKYLLILTLVLTASLTLQAQDVAPELAGRKILTGSFIGNYREQGTISQTNINTNILIGKIKDNNTYIAFGGAFSYSAVDNGSNTSIGSIGPAIESGKFVKLVDRLYLAPRIGGSIGIAFGESSGFEANFYASPIRFLYHFTDKFFLSAGFGGASVRFSELDGTTNVSISGNLTNSANIGVFFTFK